MRTSFQFEALEFQCHIVLRPSKVRKLVWTNQFQVNSTKMGTGRKFVILRFELKNTAPCQCVFVSLLILVPTGGGMGRGGGGQN